MHMDLLLRGRRGTLPLWALPVRAWAPLGPGCFCVAGARLSASGATFAWQVQQFVHMDLLLRGRRGLADLIVAICRVSIFLSSAGAESL